MSAARLGLLVLVAALSIAAAGCGGDDGSSAESWANDVCGNLIPPCGRLGPARKRNGALDTHPPILPPLGLMLPVNCAGSVTPCSAVVPKNRRWLIDNITSYRIFVK